MRVGSIGEVPARGRRVHGRGARTGACARPAARADFRATCDADLGDVRCGINLDDPDLSASASVVSTDGYARIIAALPGDRPSGFFDAGALLFTGGANAGRRSEVLRHVRDAAGDRIELWLPMAKAILPGDAFSVSAGCDKRFETCRDRFDNLLNFRGFPHMPGNDFALSYPTPEGGHQGGVLVE